MKKVLLNRECNHPTCGDICRRQKKPKKIYTLKRSPIRKRSKKMQQSLGEQKLAQQKDWDFFLEIWEEREHICFESGVPLYGEPLTLYFHHVFEKELYEEYRYCKWNIVLVTWAVHDNTHRLSDLCPKIKAYREQLTKKLKL